MSKCLNLKLSMHWRQIFPSLHTICLKLTKGRQCLFGFTWFQLIFRLIYHQWCDKTGLSNCSLSLSVTWSYEQRFKMVCLQHGINCLNAVIYYGRCAQLHLARSQACRLKKKKKQIYLLNIIVVRVPVAVRPSISGCTPIVGRARI